MSIVRVEEHLGKCLDLAAAIVTWHVLHTTKCPERQRKDSLSYPPSDPPTLSAIRHPINHQCCLRYCVV